MEIKQQASPNYSSREGWAPDLISCHITQGSYNGAITWLCNPESNASSHFVVSRAGEITQLVDIQHAAWINGTSSKPDKPYHTGYSNLQIVKDRGVNANRYTIGIEHEGIYDRTLGELTKEQEEATTWLIQYICNEVYRIYGKSIPVDRKHVVGHCDIAPRWKPCCPGQKFPFDRIISKLTENPERLKNIEALKIVEISNSPEYWILNAKPGKACDGAFVESLIAKMANYIKSKEV